MPLSESVRKRIESDILPKISNEGDHSIFKHDEGKYINGPANPIIEGTTRGIHHWLYIYHNDLDRDTKLTMKRICDRERCVNLNHWVNKDDPDAKYRIAEYFLMKNSTQEGDCRIWKASCNDHGYGVGSFAGRPMHAHIIAMFIANQIDQLPDNTVVRHRCPNQNKLCIATKHLEFGTPLQNALDKITDGTMLRGSAHPNASIDEKMALKIYQNPDRLSQREMATAYGVGLGAIESIALGKTWSHVTGHPKPERKKIEKLTEVSISDDEYVKAQDRLRKNMKEVSDPETGQIHWIWSLNKTPQGYGRTSFLGRSFGAHAISWMAFNKSLIPDGLSVLHKCKQHRDCINPEHLYLGDATQNALDVKKDGTGIRTKKIDEETARSLILSKGQGTIPDRATRFGTSYAIVSEIDQGYGWDDLRIKMGLPTKPNPKKNLPKRNSKTVTKGIIPKLKITLKANLKPKIKIQLKNVEN